MCALAGLQFVRGYFFLRRFWWIFVWLIIFYSIFHLTAYAFDKQLNQKLESLKIFIHRLNFVKTSIDFVRNVSDSNKIMIQIFNSSFLIFEWNLLLF